MNRSEFEKYAKPGDLVMVVQTTGPELDRFSKKTISMGVYLPKDDESYELSKRIFFDDAVTRHVPDFVNDQSLLYTSASNVLSIKTAKEIAKVGGDYFGKDSEIRYLKEFGLS